MRKVLVLVMALVSWAPADARADAQPILAGTTCGFVALAHTEVTGQSYEGLLFGAVSAADTRHPEANLVSVSMTCRLYVSGWKLYTATSVPGAGVAVIAYPVSFQAFPDGDYNVCTEIVATSPSGTKTVDECDPVIWSMVPPDQVCDQVALCTAGLARVRTMRVEPRIVP